MPPKWALGYHQCRWSYDSDERVREVTTYPVIDIMLAHLSLSLCWLFLNWNCTSPH